MFYEIAGPVCVVQVLCARGLILLNAVSSASCLQDCLPGFSLSSPQLVCRLVCLTVSGIFSFDALFPSRRFVVMENYVLRSSWQVRFSAPDTSEVRIYTVSSVDNKILGVLVLQCTFKNACLLVLFLIKNMIHHYKKLSL